MTTYTQKELDNAVDQARFEIMEAVKSKLGEMIINCREERLFKVGVLIRMEEIEEGFIGKSDKS